MRYKKISMKLVVGLSGLLGASLSTLLYQVSFAAENLISSEELPSSQIAHVVAGVDQRSATGGLPPPAVEQATKQEGALENNRSESNAVEVDSEAQNVLIKNAQRYITLPRMTEQEVKDLIDDVIFEMVLNNEFKRSPIQLSDSVVPPEGVTLYKLINSKAGGISNSIYFGYMFRPRRTPQLWVYSINQSGSVIQANSMFTDNILDKLLPEIYSKGKEFKSKLALKDLTAKVLNLSYVDADGALYALKAMGFSVITDDAKIPEFDSFKGKLELRPGAGGDGFGNAPSGIGFMPMPSPISSTPDLNSGLMPTAGGFGGVAAGGGFGGGMGGGFGAGMGGGMGGGAPQPQTNSMKYPTIKNLPNSVDYSQLPLIIKMPTPDEYSTGLVGATPPSAGGGGMGGAQGGGYGGAGYGASMGGSASGPSLASSSGGANSTTPPLATPITQGAAFQLMVLYDPSDIDQLVRVQKSVYDLIDKPAKQIFIEGLVIEIGSDELSKLGVQWSGTTATTGLMLGALAPITTAAAGSSAILTASNTGTSLQKFTTTLNALISSDKAEIISRPSVLTLDNRQAVIKVGTDNPIASSIASSTGTSSTNFTYQSVGISLNIRPRVSENNSEVSMLVDTSVTSIVPGGSVNVTDSNGQILATAPTINNRKIQTYARVGDGNPLIIGGLVNTIKSISKTGVPLLSDIPYLGKLFSYESPSKSKTEVIIVITPTVISEDDRIAKVNYPKDSELFNHQNDTLYRDGYRLTASDILPINHIYASQRFIDYKKIANGLKNVKSPLANEKPFSLWVDEKVPGEEIYARRAVTNLVGKLKIARQIPLSQLILLEKSDAIGFKKTSVSEILKKYGDGRHEESFFSKNPDKALVVTYHLKKDSDGYVDVRSESMPEVSLVDCQTSNDALKLLWKLNKPNENADNSDISIVIKDSEDLELLKDANIANVAISINGGNEALKFTKYAQGRLVQIPIVSAERERPVVSDVAKNFFYSKLYLQAFDTNFDLQLSLFKNAMSVLPK